MKRTHSLASATLLELLIVGSIIAASWWMNTGCATVSAAQQAAKALCKLNEERHPQSITVGQVVDASCDALKVVDEWETVAQLAAAKPNATAAKDALAAHPPLSAAANAALALPCVAPEPKHEIDTDNPYRDPQSKLDRRLYPPIIMAAPHEGE